MSKAIPAGYQLHVTTWENDGDHYETTVTSGLSKEDAEFYLHILRQFGSKHGENGLGNGEIDSEHLLTIVKEALDLHPGLSADIRAKFEHPFDFDSEADYSDDDVDNKASDIYFELQDQFGTTIDYEDWDKFMRVVEKTEVFFIEQRVKNVSTLFKQKEERKR
jgi:hypothetical protein